MYSRSYYPESTDRPTPPENYDGTAFMERNEGEMLIEKTAEASVGESKDIPVQKSISSGGLFSDGIPLLSGLFDKGGLLGGLGLKMPSIGTEEILIIATAAFLLFSKNGDRECALILLLLLFIN